MPTRIHVLPSLLRAMLPVLLLSSPTTALAAADGASSDPTLGEVATNDDGLIVDSPSPERAPVSSPGDAITSEVLAADAVPAADLMAGADAPPADNKQAGTEQAGTEPAGTDQAEDASDEFWNALTNGRVDFSTRLRSEQVDDDQAPRVRQAQANTLRTTLGYATGLFHDVGAYVQLEDVRAVGGDDYNDGGGNGVTDRAVVVDPEGTELQQAYLRYRGLPRTQVLLGRQELEHRAAPLNRFVGVVPWRQNWQSYDAARVLTDALPAMRVDYAYVWNVNRIFGEDNPISDRRDFDLDGHLLSATWSGIPYSTLEGYAYLLDFDSNLGATRALSTATYGVRLQGAWDVVSEAAKLLYTLEYAQQGDRGDNPVRLDVNYRLLELGASKAFPGPELESLMLRFGYEVLEGEGRQALGTGFVSGGFQTPLGTNHAYQGWADRFLTTPADGVEDIYGTLSVRAFGTNLMLVYHRYASTQDDYEFGDEWNLQASRVFGDRYTLGFKYARYAASGDLRNQTRNGASSTGKQAFDLTKYWLWLEVRF